MVRAGAAVASLGSLLALLAGIGRTGPGHGPRGRPAVADAAAYTQDTGYRRWPRPVRAVGVVGCLVLVATLPWTSVVTGLAVLATGLAGRAVVGRRTRDTAD